MESIETLNKRLIDHYGVDTATGEPIFRIVWSDDQTEKRMMDTLDGGIQLLYPILREVKKYPYLPHLYVLERLVAVPEQQQEELGGLKTSYEPVFAYRHENGLPLPPIWGGTKFIIDTLYAAMGKSSLRKYIDPENAETKEMRIEKIQEELFGNETDEGDALAYKQGIVVPSNYKKH